MGGLARKATIVNQALETGHPLFIVDAGDLLFKKNKLTPGIGVDVAKVNSETIIEAFNIIGCDGFNVGENDLALGLDYLMKLKSSSNFPYLSANIKSKTGTFLFKPYNILTRNDLTLGIIGLSSVFESEEVTVEDPFQSLDKIISFVKDQADVVILLFNAKDQDLTRFHQADYPVDFVIQSKSKRRSSDGGKKETPVYSCGSRGKYVYQFDFTYNDLRNEFVDIARHESAKSIMQRKITRLEKRIDQDPNPDETMLEVEDLKYKIEEEDQIIASAENIIKLNQVALDKTIIDETEILKIVDAGIVRRSAFNVQPQQPVRVQGPGIKQ